MALAAFACAGEQAADGGEDLFSVELLPDVLVEENAIALPPALGGNRYLSGWFPATSSAGQPAVRFGDGTGRIEVVHLLETPRTLALDLDLGEAGPGGRTVRVIAGGRDLGSVELADPVKVSLPADLPLGRVTVDLAVEGAPGLAPPTISAARLVPSASPGEARWEGDLLVQSGVSLVDYVRPVPPGASLAGEFQPSDHGSRRDTTSLRVEGPDGEEIGAASFAGGWLARVLGRRSFALPLGDEGGLRRFRFLAIGPPGTDVRWQRLRIIPPAGDRTTGPAPTPRFDPPRRVILYVMDALRADTVGHLGGPAGISPTLDRLAAAGAAFLRHRSVAPNTLPSTKALFTGRAVVDRGGGKLPATGAPTLAELFRRAGYRTGLFSGNVYVGPAYGTDRGFDHVEQGLEVEAGQAPFNDNAARVHRAAARWLSELPASEKAFAYLHTIHPHNPYSPPPDLAARFTAGIPSVIDGSTRTLLDIQHRRRSATEADRRRLRGLYAASFAYNDAELRSFVDRIQRLTPAEEILLIVTSDHGEELFDHGGVLHGYTLYEEMLRIPLILYAPGRIGTARIDRPTDTLDLHATLLALCGLDASAGSEGSFLLTPATRAPRRWVGFASASSLRGGIFSARSENWKAIWAPRIGQRWGMGEGLGRSRDAEYLFDLANDPGETVNLAGAGDLEAAWLRSLLLAWARRGVVAGGEEAPPPEDGATQRRLRALGYLQ